MLYWVRERKNNPNLLFLQTEDEISAIHSIIGAALGGRKSFTATSGPGFSLMQEGIGLAYAYRVPVVIVNAQRQGPSTGMPTLFSQDNILQTQWGTHGDHISIVFSPNSVQECYEMAIHSFNAACESRSPVILLSDGAISMLYETFERKHNIPISEFPIEPFGSETRHFTGLTNVNGVPDTKNAESYKKWISEITMPIVETSKKYNFYEYKKNSKSNTLLISFGFLSRVTEEWEKEFSLFRPIRLFPVLEDELLKISKDYENIILVEGNYRQYKMVLEATLKREIKEVSVVGGSIKPSDIYQEVKNLLK